MRRNDLTPEWIALAQLLELRPGDTALDAQSDGDALLPILATEVTERGTCVGMTFGQQAFQKVQAQREEYGMDEVEVVAAHPIQTPFRDDRFHAVVVRHTLGFPSLEPVVLEMSRITRSGGKVIFRHTEWNVELPEATEEELEMLETLKSRCCSGGRNFFARFEKFSQNHHWREVRVDVFTIAHSAGKSPSRRYNYDWRTMMKEQLVRTRRFETRPILDLITRIEETEDAHAIAERYVIMGIKA
jgi:ubiquinone/menaquinone biosynthesis C-methylase UbiE